MGAGNCPAAGPLAAARAGVNQEGRLKAGRGYSQSHVLMGLHQDPSAPRARWVEVRPLTPYPSERKLGVRGPQPPKALGSLWARGLERRSRPPSPVLAPEAQPGTRSPTPACCPLGQVPRSRAGRRRHRPQVKLPRTPRPDAACLCVGAPPLPPQWA